MPENAQVILTPGTLPEGACYETEQERLNAFIEVTAGQLPDTYSTINVGSTAPQPNDRNNPWHRTNTDGSPDYPGMWDYFDGAWRQRHPLPPGIIAMYDGDASLIPTLDGGTAGTATLYSGPFWEVVTQLQARFPVGAGTFPTAGAVAVGATGGEERVTLETKHLPEVLGRFGTDVEKAFAKKSGAGGAANGGAGGPYFNLDLADFIKGGTTDADKSHNNLPPYYVVSFIRRTARLYRQAS